ncbi:hypothetical protein LJC47_07775 [Desulfosarcina sp. OttesenSCG-928-B08]|nr:hypothetical protein [Desulfosarcina sp. OttesenSCG-928-B08]
MNFPIHLIDLATIPMDQLKGHPAIRALFQALQAASEEKLEEQFDQVTDQLMEAKDDARILDWLSAIIRYMMSLCRPEKAEERIVKAYSRLIDEEEAKKMATSFVAELEARGEAKGVLTFLEARFGSVPQAVKSAVTACTDLAKLDALIRLAATCGSIDEFKQGLPQA